MHFNVNHMKIVTETITIDEIKEMAAKLFGDMVKAVVDVEKDVLAVDAELHSDLEALLLDNGSKQKSLWGINIYPDKTRETWLEFNSLINIKPAFGNRSMDIENIGVKEKIKKIIDKIVI